MNIRSISFIVVSIFTFQTLCMELEQTTEETTKTSENNKKLTLRKRRLSAGLNSLRPKGKNFEETCISYMTALSIIQPDLNKKTFNTLDLSKKLVTDDDSKNCDLDEFLQKFAKVLIARIPNQGLLISPEIKKDYQVTTVDLSHNRLTEIPDALFSLKNLLVLILNHNKIKKITPKISSFGQLRRLKLNFNTIEEIDDAVGLLPKLFAIELKHNPKIMVSLNLLKELSSKEGFPFKLASKGQITDMASN